MKQEPVKVPKPAPGESRRDDSVHMARHLPPLLPRSLNWSTFWGWWTLLGSKSVQRNQCQKIPRKCLLWQREIKLKRKEKREKPKSNFVSTPRRIHMISLRERLLQALDKRIPNNETTTKPYRPSHRWGESNQTHRLNGRVRLSAPSNSPNGRVGSNKSSNSQNRRVGSKKQFDSPVRRVGSISLISSHPHSSLLRDRIEPALFSSWSESPLVECWLKNLCRRAHWGSQCLLSSMVLQTFQDHSSSSV